MIRSAISIGAACLAVVLWGCAVHPPASARQGKAVFSALQQAVEAAGSQVKSTLVLVKLETTSDTQPPVTSGRTIIIRGSSSPASLGGIILTDQGHVLVPRTIKLDQDMRITVFVGDDEFNARPLKTDSALDMTILKLDADESFQPLDISRGADLSLGEWALVLKAGDEDLDYQSQALLGVCQGERVGPYRRFLLNQSLGALNGALVVNLSGQVVGFVDDGVVLALNDVRDDLQRLLDDATNRISPDEDKKKQGWLGAIFQPVNKDYARARNLSASSLLVLHVVGNSPAAAAGLRSGDMIVALNGKPLRMTGSRLLDYFSKSLHPRTGEKFLLTVLRGGASLELSGTFAKMPEPDTLRAEDLGVTVSGITESEFFSKNLATDKGVLVTDVHRGSPAANSGSLRQTLLSSRDIIIELAGHPTPTIEAFGAALENIRRDRPPVVLVKYYRGCLTGYAGLNLALGEKDNGSKQ